MDPRNLLWGFPVGWSENLSFIRPRGTGQALKIKAGHHICHRTVSIVSPNRRVEGFVPRGQDDRPHIDVYLLWLLGKINGLVFTHTFTDETFLLFQVETGIRVHIGYKGNRLLKVDMDGLVIG